MELLELWDAYKIHSAYYLERHVNAALQRCLGLPPYNVKVADWFAECNKPFRKIHFWPSTRSRNTMMISTYFGSDRCSLCGRKCTAGYRSRAAVCNHCQANKAKAIGTTLRSLSDVQQQAQELATKCAACNLCEEDGSTFAQVREVKVSKSTQSKALVTPLANCSCIDCPTTFDRHRIVEREIEAIAICQALNAL